MDIVERLRTLTVYNWHTVTEIDKEEVLTPLFFFVNQAADEIERLREDKAELVEALIDMRNHINKRDWDENVSNGAKATFAKATGGG